MAAFFSSSRISLRSGSAIRLPSLHKSPISDQLTLWIGDQTSESAQIFPLPPLGISAGALAGSLSLPPSRR